MPLGMRKLTWVSGEGSPPVVLAIVKPNPIVVDAPSLSGVNDVCKATVSAACAAAGNAETAAQTTTAQSVSIRALVKVSPSSLIRHFPLTCTVTASSERWIVPLKLRAEAFALE